MTRYGDNVGSVTWDLCSPELDNAPLLFVKLEVSRLKELESYL